MFEFYALLIFYTRKIPYTSCIATHLSVHQMTVYLVKNPPYFNHFNQEMKTCKMKIYPIIYFRIVTNQKLQYKQNYSRSTEVKALGCLFQK